MKEITPNFKTPDDQINEVERFKLQSGIRGQLKEEFSDLAVDDVQHETEALAKSHGIYLEFNRAKTGKEKDWMFMVRISIPGGGPLNRRQYALLDDLATRFTANEEGEPSLRMTTRQNIQFHWIKKKDLIEMVRAVAKSGFYTLNGCGDNVRNVMGCPLSLFSDTYNANALAQQFGKYFQLDAEPHLEIFGIDPDYMRDDSQKYTYGKKLLNRKFKIAFSAIHRDEETGKYWADNCVELRTNDMGVAPILKEGKVSRFQIYLGGGQGERNGKASFAAMGKPLCILTENELQKGLDAIVKVHEEWGDRANRHWARVKYVVHKMGIPWYQEQLKKKGVTFDPPDESFNIGARCLHHGWMKQPNSGKWAFGAFVECGRIIDSGERKLKSMARHLMDNWDVQMLITPNQDVIFTDIPEEKKAGFEAELHKFGFGERAGKPYSVLRRRSGACVALPTCRLAYTDSERFLPELIDELESRGYGEVAESIGITGCERQCFRPSTKSIGWVGSGKNQYQLRLMGSEDASTQGMPLTGKDNLVYFRMTPRDRVADICAALIDGWQQNRNSESETMGAYHHRIGMQTIINYLKAHPKTTELSKKTFKPIYIHSE